MLNRHPIDEGEKREDERKRKEEDEEEEEEGTEANKRAKEVIEWEEREPDDE